MRNIITLLTLPGLLGTTMALEKSWRQIEYSLKEDAIEGSQITQTISHIVKYKEDLASKIFNTHVEGRIAQVKKEKPDLDEAQYRATLERDLTQDIESWKNGKQAFFLIKDEVDSEFKAIFAIAPEKEKSNVRIKQAWFTALDQFRKVLHEIQLAYPDAVSANATFSTTTRSPEKLLIQLGFKKDDNPHKDQIEEHEDIDPKSFERWVYTFQRD